MSTIVRQSRLGRARPNSVRNDSNCEFKAYLSDHDLYARRTIDIHVVGAIDAVAVVGHTEEGQGSKSPRHGCVAEDRFEAKVHASLRSPEHPLDIEKWH